MKTTLRVFQIAALGLLAVLNIGCVTVYGKRSYQTQDYLLVDRKDGRPVAGVTLMVSASYGPEILPSYQLFRPRTGAGRTDEWGRVTMVVPVGPRIRPFARAEKDGLLIWSVETPEGSDWGLVDRSKRVVLTVDPARGESTTRGDKRMIAGIVRKAFRPGDSAAWR